ncbi:hypothetical protein T4E_909 [Trichinella pseudospiralis]|uniref:Uncharacterized protein n=1 Tax=Trichinella pseudospiralis TaxID=6337 RepID=A0A0V0XYT5_TRIPS|nr:hypothetical protein T4E_909 [Trichinella pseudospiralis]
MLFHDLYRKENVIALAPQNVNRQPLKLKPRKNWQTVAPLNSQTWLQAPSVFSFPVNTRKKAKSSVLHWVGKARFSVHLKVAGNKHRLAAHPRQAERQSLSDIFSTRIAGFPSSCSPRHAVKVTENMLI